MHYIDYCALADPLLARLPAKETSHWRIGHFPRQLPTYYKESIEQGKNILADQKTASYWESIRTVTRGELFDRNRFVEIARLNLGLVQRPDWEMYRTQNIPRTTSIPVKTESDFNTVRTEGTVWNAFGNIVFDTALDIILTTSTNIKSIDVSLDDNDFYEITGFRNHESVLLAMISPGNTFGLARHIIHLDTIASDIDKI